MEIEEEKNVFLAVSPSLEQGWQMEEGLLPAYSIPVVTVLKAEQRSLELVVFEQCWHCFICSGRGVKVTPRSRPVQRLISLSLPL